MGIHPFFSDCLVSSCQVNVQNMICLMASHVVFWLSYCKLFVDKHTKSHAISANFDGQNEPLGVSFRRPKKKLVFHNMLTNGATGPPILTHRGARLALYGASGAYLRLIAPRILKCKKTIRIQKVRGRCVHLQVFSPERPLMGLSTETLHASRF